MLWKQLSGLAAATALAVSLVHPVAAAEPVTDGQGAALHVSTVGLDLTQQADQARLKRRIAVAASKLCAEILDASSTTDPGFSDCFSRVAADARAQAELQIAAAQSRAMVATTH